MVDMVMRLGPDANSSKAFAAYSEMLCIENDLAHGICVKDWMSRTSAVGERAVVAWRAYSKRNEDLYIMHNQVMNIHGRSIAGLVASMGTCVP
jgi:hypothetical protein